MASSGNAAGTGKILKRADPSTIQDKFLVGYQGWFTCPGDGPPLDPHHHGWLHWFTYPIPDGGRPNTDLWPDVSEYSPSELFPAPGLKYANGEQAFLFSSRNARTVERHFHWMALHGVDGAFLQRFLGQCDLEQGNEPIRNQRDEVGGLVKQAAEKEGRVFAIMYDIAGVAPDRIQRIIEKDWIHLLRNQRLLDSPNYLREKGKPVVTIWGFGMSDQNHDPATVRAVTQFIRDNTPGGAYIMGGGPAHWRTSTSDADRNPEWVNVWLECFDAISPWTVGRYGDMDGADSFAENNVKGDLELIRKRNEEAEQGMPGRRHIDYIPVILPGGSGFNLSEGHWSWNGIKRLGGRFLWRQAWNLRRQGVRTIYGAMWDEYDEGTAFMPVVSKKRQVPVHDKYNFMALDEDGYDLPSDWYMRICGFIAESLRGDRLIQETFPSKELDDYWSTRPRYEDATNTGPSGSGSGKEQSWEEWEKLDKEKGGQDEPPPPPYTLEAEEPAIPPRPAVTNVVAAAPTTTLPATGPPTAPRPDVSLPAVGELGALNAGPSRSPERPPIPLASRPSIVRPSGSHAPDGVPPPIPSRPRPQPSFASQSSSASVSSITEDLGRQSISSAPPPRIESPPQHPSRVSASRPTSPARPPSTCPNPAFPGYSPSPYPQSQTPPTGPPHGPPYGATSFPAPGFAPPTAQHAPSPSPGPWSQAPWPPPEWGAPPASPVSTHVPYTPYQSHSRPTAGPQMPGYGPSYTSSYNPSPPPLAPRPSMSASHSPSPPPRPSSSYGPQTTNQDYGGYGFPQAQTMYPQSQSSYGPPPPQPYTPYGGGPSFPSGPAPYGYGPPSSAPPPPGGSSYGGYGPSTYPSLPSPTSGSGGMPPHHPPPSHPPTSGPTLSTYPGSTGSSRPPGSQSSGVSGMLGTIAQTGISTGGKLFNKLRK